MGHTVWGYLAGRAPSPSAGCSLTAGPAPARLQALVPPGTRRGAPLPHPASSAPAVRSWRRRSVCLSSSAGAHRLGSWGSWIEKLQTDKFCHGATLLQGSTHAPGSPKPLHGSILQKKPHTNNPSQLQPAAKMNKGEGRWKAITAQHSAEHCAVSALPGPGCEDWANEPWGKHVISEIIICCNYSFPLAAQSRHLYTPVRGWGSSSKCKSCGRAHRFGGLSSCRQSSSRSVVRLFVKSGSSENSESLNFKIIWS